ncbi:radical SAM family heme chaperone HemW [Catenisphaera adipataccumulans]|uniref:Heme chaperone HemW n=1 Tax=Catenisphaera adipataccumulans TaxID=700500 RepID=A0A7W8CX07_9FIRM|nr:radical SAM family heme chaperone HemW [Catenisphaera adipataccumulans]MBB5183180.1 oxygen-independent coproporphyrinogen-3 oxidase [Catenisphaera adipataccumulans]
MKHIYVHIPFCDGICFYCGFYRQTAGRQVREAWLERICETPVQKTNTLYFGGGTPSCLDTDQLDRLCAHFADCLLPGYEWTIEANPENLTAEKIAVMGRYGINRVSLGVQTFSDPLLKKIGRRHTADDARRAIRLLRQSGIENISIDLIYGLPGQMQTDVEQDLNEFLQLQLPHLSIYALQIEPNSVFGKQGIPPLAEETDADWYEMIVRTLKAVGYEHYEISSFCRPGMYSRHNLGYWNDDDFIGIGPGAAGREGHQRYLIERDLQRFIQVGETRCPEPTDAPFEAIMMGLRTMFGVDIEKWNQTYQNDLEKTYQAVLQKYMPDFLTIENGHLIATEAGMEQLNSILVDFLGTD